jgi:hypothetical protein
MVDKGISTAVMFNFLASMLHGTAYSQLVVDSYRSTVVSDCELLTNGTRCEMLVSYTGLAINDSQGWMVGTDSYRYRATVFIDCERAVHASWRVISTTQGGEVGCDLASGVGK